MSSLLLLLLLHNPVKLFIFTIPYVALFTTYFRSCCCVCVFFFNPGPFNLVSIWFWFGAGAHEIYMVPSGIMWWWRMKQVYQRKSMYLSWILWAWSDSEQFSTWSGFTHHTIECISSRQDLSTHTPAFASTFIFSLFFFSSPFLNEHMKNAFPTHANRYNLWNHINSYLDRNRDNI